MKKTLSLVIIAVLLLACAAVYFVRVPAMKAEAEATADRELNGLIDAAFLQLDDAKALADAADGRAGREVLAVARAAERIVGNDDAMLNEEALKTLAEQLNVTRIVFLTADGVALASSEQSDVGKNFAEEAETAWLRAAFSNPGTEYSASDADEPSLRVGCVWQTEGGGLLVVVDRNETVAAANAAADSGNVFRAMSFLHDSVTPADGGETTGVCASEGVYRVVRSQDGIIVKAERKLSEMYREPRTVTFVLIGAAAAILVSGGAAVLLNAGRPEYDEYDEFTERSDGESETGEPEPAEEAEPGPEPETEPTADSLWMRAYPPQGDADDGISLEEMLRRIEEPPEYEKALMEQGETLVERIRRFSGENSTNVFTARRGKPSAPAEEQPAEQGTEQTEAEQPVEEEVPVERPKKRRKRPEAENPIETGFDEVF